MFTKGQEAVGPEDNHQQLDFFFNVFNIVKFIFYPQTTLSYSPCMQQPGHPSRHHLGAGKENKT